MQKNYEINIPHFYCLDYYEGRKKMTLDIDFRDSIIYLNKELIDKWDSPYDVEVINTDKKLEIINNIYLYLSETRGFTNVKLEI